MPGSLGRVHTGAFSFCWSHFLSFILPLWAVKQDPFSSSLSSTSTEPQRRVLWGLQVFISHSVNILLSSSFMTGTSSEGSFLRNSTPKLDLKLWAG